MNGVAILFALTSAALFGFQLRSPNPARIVHPAVLAGLFYCGAGLGVALLRRLRRSDRMPAGAPEVALGRRDLPWLAGAVVSGGVAAPLLLMIGLAADAAAAASLLLTPEGAATALIARFVFGESYGPRLALGMACLITGACLLSCPARRPWTGS